MKNHPEPMYSFWEVMHVGKQTDKQMDIITIHLPFPFGTGVG